MSTLALSLGTQQRARVPHASIAGTNDSGGPYGTPDLPKDHNRAFPSLNEVVTSWGNRPHYLLPSQWQSDNDLNYDHSITNAFEARDNAGGAMMDFSDVCNVNGSLDANMNAYRSNANGLEWQFGGTNPKTVPYMMHQEIEPNGFTNAFNPIVPPPTRVHQSSSSAWSDAMYDTPGNALMRMIS